uniref:Uncharacterized protein n=1 Tax=Rhizophora mucronata TaxID=61149 RepID=A0A2P2NQJ3_RHIMU
MLLSKSHNSILVDLFWLKPIWSRQNWYFG